MQNLMSERNQGTFWMKKLLKRSFCCKRFRNYIKIEFYSPS
jgi:hypothetical protein